MDSVVVLAWPLGMAAILTPVAGLAAAAQVSANVRYAASARSRSRAIRGLR
jgi:hypothetical protein